MKSKRRSKKRRTSLPRLTVFSMSRRELVEFVTAVETMRLYVRDMQMLIGELAKLIAAAPRKQPRKRGPAAAAAAQAAAEGEGSSSMSPAEGGGA